MTKNIELNTAKRYDNFWLIAGVLAMLLATSMSRDVFRPFYGLHSWGEAHPYWNARVHLNYGFGYTKGMMTKAVGNPPTENPLRYLNHPQIPSLVMDLPFMAIFGQNELSLRIPKILAAIATLLMFLKLLRGLVDDKTALLAGLFFTLFPLTAYFGVAGWYYFLLLFAIWNYFTITKSLVDAPEPCKWNWLCLIVSLFWALQHAWEAFFFAFAIGVHFVFRSLKNYIQRKELPDFKLLAVLVVAPLLSLFVNILVMTAGSGWDWGKFGKIFLWRSTTGEMQQHDWGDWFATLWEFGVTNFTLPILILAIGYLTVGQLFVFMEKDPNRIGNRRLRQFPQFWLFFMIPLFQLFILKGCLWKHQTWERPLMFITAIAAAQGVMLISDMVKKVNKRLANTVVLLLVGVVFVTSVQGANYYYGIRWQSPNKIKMLKQLNNMIPPDKRLLSFESFIVDQGGDAKIPFIRPEIAWYLDRQITEARTLEDIVKYTGTGLYPYYLVPNVGQLQPLIRQLQKQYKLESYVAGDPGEQKDGKFYRAGMMNYMIFKLQ